MEVRFCEAGTPQGEIKGLGRGLRKQTCRCIHAREIAFS